MNVVAGRIIAAACCGSLFASAVLSQSTGTPERFSVVRHDGVDAIIRSADGRIETPDDLSRAVKVPTSAQVATVPAGAGRTLAAFVVTSAADDPDSDLNDELFSPATLRSAIQNANKLGGSSTIAFASGITTIAPVSNLPSVTVPVTIDGSVAAGKVILDGSAITSNGWGLVLGSNSTVRNVSFRHWVNVGLAFGSGSTNITVQRNEFFNNLTGLNLNSDGGTIGGDDPQDGNVAADNTQSGISLIFANNLVIKNNLIGTKDGMTAAPNTNEGLYIMGSKNRVERNVISGNSQRGLSIGEFADRTMVRDNIIGLDSTGRNALGNAWTGVNIMGSKDSILSNVISGNGWGIQVAYQADETFIQGNIVGPTKQLDSLRQNTQGGIYLVGTPVTVDSNIISGNNWYGININGYGGAMVRRNKIGTDPTGTIAWPNWGAGVNIVCDNNVIGGPSPADGNLISGNQWGGIEMFGGTTLVFGGPSVPNLVQGNLIQNNTIGTDITGTQSLSNFTGLFMNGYIDSNVVRGNLISGNRNHGVWTRRSPDAPSRNTFQANRIGTTADGLSPLPNDSCGMMIDSADVNLIGGPNDGDGNIIAFSHQAGIAIKAGWGTSILRNSIFNNKGMAIDLGFNGPTPNDSGDVDAGPHRLNNYPRITWIHNSGASTTVRGRVESRPLRTYRLEFYTNDQADSTGFGEAQTFQTSIDVVTDSAGRAPFEVIIPGGFGRVVGTSTHSDDGTSEVSKAPFVVNSTADRSDADPGDGLASTSGPQVNGAPEVTLRSALQASNHVPGEDDIAFDIPGTGAQFILPQSQLSQANGDVTIDGTTQPGHVSGAVPIVQVLGTNAGIGSNGLRLAGDRSTVRGLYLSGFMENGIDASGDRITLGEVTANANKKYGVRASHHVVLDGDLIVSGNGPAAPSAAGCSGDNAAGLWVGGWLLGEGDVTASGNCGPGVRQTGELFDEGGIQMKGSFTATGNAGSGIWANGDVSITGEELVFSSNGFPKKTANGVRSNQGVIALEGTGAGPFAAIRASGNSHTGILAQLGSIQLKGKAEVSNNGAGLTVVECLNAKVTGLRAYHHIRTQDLVVDRNGYDGIKAGHSLVVEGNLTSKNHPGRGVWAIHNIRLDGTEHLVENNLDGAIWAANGWLDIKGKLIARGNKVGAHHGVEESPDRTDALVGAVEAYLGIRTEDLEIHNNVPSGITTWESIVVRGNIDIRNNAVRGMSAMRGIRIFGTQHVVSGNRGDGMVTNQEQVIVRGSILLEGNGGIEGEGYGIVGSNMLLDDVTARGNTMSGIRGYGTVTIHGSAVAVGNALHGIHASGTVTLSGGRLCDNGGYGIAAPIVRMSGVEVCANGGGGISGRVVGAPGTAPNTPSFRTLVPPALASSIVRGSSITGNGGNGLDVDSPYPFRIEGSNLSGNAGLAVSATGGGSVKADGNWWGSAAGPGAAVSGSVTAGTWLGASVGMFIGTGNDSVFVLPGDTGAVSIVAVNWSAASDSFNVDAVDSRGWLATVSARPMVQRDSIPAVASLAYVIPVGAAPGDSSRVVVAGSGTLSPGLTVRDTIVLVVYTPALHEIALLADTIVAAPGDTVRLSAAGFDQSGRAIAFTPAWSATGGTIDSSGVYHAGTGLGTFVVRVTDTSSGLKDSAYVRIVPPLSPLPGTIVSTAAAVDAGQVVAGTQATVAFSITNASGGMLTIDSLTTTTTAFAPVWDPSVNLLRVGDTLEVGVMFSPVAAMGYTDTLFVYNSSPVSPLKIPLSGNGSTTGVDGASELPTAYALDQNYPNPFNPSTTIRFALPVASRVRLTVHDMLGREVARLEEGVRAAGFATVVWAPQASSGVYFVRIDATSLDGTGRRFVEVRRMVMVK